MPEQKNNKSDNLVVNTKLVKAISDDKDGAISLFKELMEHFKIYDPGQDEMLLRLQGVRTCFFYYLSVVFAICSKDGQSVGFEKFLTEKWEFTYSHKLLEALWLDAMATVGAVHGTHINLEEAKAHQGRLSFIQKLKQLKEEKEDAATI